MAARVDAKARLVFLDSELVQLAARFRRRNAELPTHGFAVSSALLAQCQGWLERPGPDEAVFQGVWAGGA